MYTDISCWSSVKSIMNDRWQWQSDCPSTHSAILVPAIKRAVYINTHCNYSQPQLTKLYNENIGGHPYTFTLTYLLTYYCLDQCQFDSILKLVDVHELMRILSISSSTHQQSTNLPGNLPGTAVPGRILIRPRTKQTLVQKQVHLVISVHVQSSFKCVHTASFNNSLFQLIPVVDNTFWKEMKTNVSVCAMSG